MFLIKVFVRKFAMGSSVPLFTYHPVFLISLSAPCKNKLQNFSNILANLNQIKQPPMSQKQENFSTPTPQTQPNPNPHLPIYFGNFVCVASYNIISGLPLVASCSHRGYWASCRQYCAIYFARLNIPPAPPPSTEGGGI